MLRAHIWCYIMFLWSTLIPITYVNTILVERKTNDLFLFKISNKQFNIISQPLYVLHLSMWPSH